MAIQIDIFSDVVCPWCLIGKTRLEQALARFGQPVAIRWQPFELNPDMPKEGVERNEYRVQKFGSLERSQELDANIQSIGDAEGIPFRFERMQRTPNTFDAHRLIWLAGQQDRQEEIVDRLFRAYFTNGEDVGDQEVLVRIAVESGMDANATRNFLASDKGTAEVRDAEHQGQRMGINGVPFFVLNNKWALSGAQPVEQFLSALEMVSKESE